MPNMAPVPIDGRPYVRIVVVGNRRAVAGVASESCPAGGVWDANLYPLKRHGRGHRGTLSRMRQTSLDANSMFRISLDPAGKSTMLTEWIRAAKRDTNASREHPQ